jgi:hypothetical protein
MKELGSELGVIADFSALEVRTSAMMEMTAEGIQKLAIDVLQNTAFSLYEAAEMGSCPDIPNSAGRCISILFEIICKCIDIRSADSPAQTPQRLGRGEVFF